MITKIRFVRNQKGNPTVELVYDTYVPDQIWKLDLTEEAYTEWVPDTNGPGYKGENLKDGIMWDVPVIPNLKAT
jgi:hypothetical protein